MGKVIQLSLNDLRGRLVEPPIIDLLHPEVGGETFAITLVPHDTVSAAQTEHISVGQRSPEGQRIAGRLRQLQDLLRRGPVIRIVHSGGGNFTVHFASGQWLELADETLGLDETLAATDALRDMAQAAEIALVLASRS